MVIRNNKLKISIEKLSFEFEGSREDAQAVQQGIQQTLGSLMNTQSRLLDYRNDLPKIIEAKSSDTSSAVAPATGDASLPTMHENGEKPKQPRTRRAKAESPTAIMREMKAEGFFLNPRSASEIQKKLEVMGHTVSISTVSARLKDLVKKKELFRDNGSEEGSYVYKDNQFHESPRSPSSPDQPAE